MALGGKSRREVGGAVESDQFRLAEEPSPLRRHLVAGFGVVCFARDSMTTREQFFFSLLNESRL